MQARMNQAGRSINAAMDHADHAIGVMSETVSGQSGGKLVNASAPCAVSRTQRTCGAGFPLLRPNKAPRYRVGWPAPKNAKPKCSFASELGLPALKIEYADH